MYAKLVLNMYLLLMYIIVSGINFSAWSYILCVKFLSLRGVIYSARSYLLCTELSSLHGVIYSVWKLYSLYRFSTPIYSL